MAGPTPKRFGQGRRGCFDGDADPSMRLLQLSVETLRFGHQFDGEVVACLFDRRCRFDRRQRREGVGSVEFLGDPPGASSIIVLWSRHTMRVRSLPISMLRLAKRRSTSLWSAPRTV